MYPEINKINTKDIAATIVEEGFIIGKNNAVDISLRCDALEIYKHRQPLNILRTKIKRKPLHIGTIYFKENGNFSKSWYFDNNNIGTPIIELAKKLENTYDVKVFLNNEYDVVWDKDDPGV